MENTFHSCHDIQQYNKQTRPASIMPTPRERNNYMEENRTGDKTPQPVDTTKETRKEEMQCTHSQSPPPLTYLSLLHLLLQGTYSIQRPLYSPRRLLISLFLLLNWKNKRQPSEESDHGQRPTTRFSPLFSLCTQLMSNSVNNYSATCPLFPSLPRSLTKQDPPSHIFLQGKEPASPHPPRSPPTPAGKERYQTSQFLVWFSGSLAFIYLLSPPYERISLWQTKRKSYCFYVSSILITPPPPPPHLQYGEHKSNLIFLSLARSSSGHKFLYLFSVMILQPCIPTLAFLSPVSRHFSPMCKQINLWMLVVNFATPFIDPSPSPSLGYLHHHETHPDSFHVRVNI